MWTIPRFIPNEMVANDVKLIAAGNMVGDNGGPATETRGPGLSYEGP
jgi:hypothetical protein